MNKSRPFVSGRLFYLFIVVGRMSIYIPTYVICNIKRVYFDYDNLRYFVNKSYLKEKWLGSS